MAYGLPPTWGQSYMPYGGGYGGYGGYGMYSPYTGSTFGPYQSAPLTPVEHLQATNHELHAEHNGSFNGLLGGAILGGGAAALFGAIGSGAAAGAVGGPVGIAVGAIGGALVGFLGGGKLSKILSIYGDAKNDGKLNGGSGSPMSPYGYSGNH